MTSNTNDKMIINDNNKRVFSETSFDSPTKKPKLSCTLNSRFVFNTMIPANLSSDVTNNTTNTNITNNTNTFNNTTNTNTFNNTNNAFNNTNNTINNTFNNITYKTIDNYENKRNKLIYAFNSWYDENRFNGMFIYNPQLNNINNMIANNYHIMKNLLEELIKSVNNDILIMDIYNRTKSLNNQLVFIHGVSRCIEIIYAHNQYINTKNNLLGLSVVTGYIPPIIPSSTTFFSPSIPPKVSLFKK